MNGEIRTSRENEVMVGLLAWTRRNDIWIDCRSYLVIQGEKGLVIARHPYVQAARGFSDMGHNWTEDSEVRLGKGSEQ